MNYGNILTTTWKTIWKEKAILWFGMLMAVIPIFFGLLVGVAVVFTSPEQIEYYFTSDLGNLVVIVLALLYFFVILASFILSALSFTGMMKGTLMAQQGDEGIRFSQLWEASLPYLWRMLGIILSMGLLFIFIFSVPVIFLVLFGALTAGVGFLCALPLMLLLIPLGIVSYLLYSISMAILIVEDSKVFETIQRAWEVLKANFWPLILMTIILYFIQMAIGMVISIPMQVIQFAFIIPMQASDISPEIYFRGFGILIALFIPISTILQSLSITYVNGAWLLSYLEIKTTPLDSEEKHEIIYDA